MTNLYIIDDVSAPSHLLGRLVRPDDLFQVGDEMHYVCEVGGGRRVHYYCSPIRTATGPVGIMCVGPHLTGRDFHLARQFKRCFCLPINGRYVSKFGPGSARRGRRPQANIDGDSRRRQDIRSLLKWTADLDSGKPLSDEDQAAYRELRFLYGYAHGQTL